MQPYASSRSSRGGVHTINKPMEPGSHSIDTNDFNIEANPPQHTYTLTVTRVPIILLQLQVYSLSLLAYLKVLIFLDYLKVLPYH